MPVVADVSSETSVSGVIGKNGELGKHRYAYWCILPILLLFVLDLVAVAVVKKGTCGPKCQVTSDLTSATSANASAGK